MNIDDKYLYLIFFLSSRYDNLLIKIGLLYKSGWK